MKKLILIPVILISLLASIYVGGWLYMERKIEHGIIQFFNNIGPSFDMTFTGQRPIISGFPGVPVLTYEGGFTSPVSNLRSEKIIFKGYPLPNFPVTIKSEGDMFYWNTSNNLVGATNEFFLKFKMPSSFPKSKKAYHIQEWQKSVGNIEIMEFFIKSDHSEIRTSGHIGLDNDLQSTCDLSFKVSGYKVIIDYLTKEKIISPLHAALMLTFLNATAEQDNTSGNNQVTLDTTIKDNLLFINSLKVTNTPTINWQ